MAASTSSLVRINDTDANFRAWGSAISAALLAGGLVQTADTGQINWTTVVKPAAINTAQGYEIWRSNDASGSLNNFYFKIEYGSGGATNDPAIWITLGWSSNGSGTINSTNVTSRVQILVTSSSGSAVACNFATGTGYVSIAMWGANTTAGQMFILSMERVRDNTGAFEDKVAIWATNCSSIYFNQTVPRTGTNGTNNQVNIMYGWRSQSQFSSSYAGNKGVGTFAPNLGGFLMESANLFNAYTSDVTPQNQYAFQVYGATRTYMALGVSMNASVTGGNIYFLTRYE